MRQALKKAACFAGAGAMAVTSFLVTSPAFGQGDTYRQPNGPESCVIFDASGNVIAPKPGDCAQFGKAGQGRATKKAKNVILLIGDGMGQSEITVARNYLKGAAGRLDGIDELTSEGQYTHFSVNKDGSINYVTDSAASGSAWATGAKTYNGALGVEIDGTKVPNLIEKAKNAGMRTGNVTTSEIQDATPAAIGSHVSNRSYYAPSGTAKPAKDGDLRENGGWGSISEQLVETRADVTLGGGAKYFDAEVVKDGSASNTFLNESDKGRATQWKAGDSVLDNAKANGFQVVTTSDELSKVTNANQDTPLLGLFAPGNMTTTFAPLKATPGGGTQPGQYCEEQNIGTEPELKDMTEKAIALLDDPNSDKGFFLQVESASIDKQDHAANACGQIGETKRLDEATKAALDFAKADGNTLVVVTADHSHTSQIIYEGDSVALAANLITFDGSTMTVGYGTAEQNGSQQHTGAQLRVAAYGPGEENVLGQTDQTDLHYTILNALGIDDGSAAPLASSPLPKPVDAQQPNQTCYKFDDAGNMVAPAPGECAQYGTTGEQRSGEYAQNVILFIGDGMGDSEITSARNYLYGAAGRLPGIDNLDFTGSYTHFSLNKDTGKPNYVTDSAASGTAWSTGTKTYNGAIGVDALGKPVENLLEEAKLAGLKTGNVSTAEIQDATPAVLGAHVTNRSYYAPSGDKKPAKDQDLRENGGLGSISEQLVDTRADVTLGGGASYFNAEVKANSGNTNPFLGEKRFDTKWAKGSSVLDNAKANGYKVVTTASELDSVASADQSHPLLGLFTPGNMPRTFSPTVPTTDGASQPAVRCELNPDRTADVPTLAAMTKKAINLLDNENGFFLQVEGASIDKADHAADACGQIGELDDLDQAVQAAQQWVKESGQPTLIIVTADHAHTSQITGGNTLGRTTKLLTADGSEMNLSYNNASSNEDKDALGGQGHTGAQLRIAASGPGAENVVGRTDQTDMHFTIYNALNLSQPRTSGDQPSRPVQETKALPKTGDQGLPFMAIALMTLVATGVVVKRRMH